MKWIKNENAQSMNRGKSVNQMQYTIYKCYNEIIEN